MTYECMGTANIYSLMRREAILTEIDYNVFPKKKGIFYNNNIVIRKNIVRFPYTKTATTFFHYDRNNKSKSSS